MSMINLTSVIAADDDKYYYDVKKAGNYALYYCGANAPDKEKTEFGSLPETRKGRIGDNNYNHDFSFFDSDCTNFVSQILYYGGYEMMGSPENYFFDFKGSTSRSSNDWYYYKLKDNFDNVNKDVYSSTWTLVERYILNPTSWGSSFSSGLAEHFTSKIKGVDNPRYTVNGSDINNKHYCNSIDDVKYCDDFASKYNLHRGDILQLADDSSEKYYHTMFVWATEPEVEFVAHTDPYFAKSLSAVSSDHPDRVYSIIYTTDYADQSKRRW